ncbi:MAG TPA: DUF1801 domain-containing protein [Candidatus Saccharimonas sp.]|nr:DUF1801 domain-containing protein [Candidatus Saccharimonas sp.]
MSELKTTPTGANVAAYLAGIADERQRQDAIKIVALMQQVTGEQPVMWGTGIVGFGSFRYKYASGREVDWMKVGFSARKTALTLYGLVYYDHPEELDKLGKYTTGKGCLYIKSLADVDLDVLAKMIENGYKGNKHESVDR